VVRWPSGDPDTVARRVLAQREFANLHASTAQKPQPSIWEIVGRWIVEHILRPLFGPISHAIGASKGVGTVAGLVLIALAIAALGYVVFRLALAFAPTFARAGAASGGRPLEALETHEDWLEIARAAGARGDYRRAIGALFSASLAALDDCALVGFDAARTPGEYRRLVRRARAAASASFDELAERFVRAVYAQQLPERSDFEAAERALAAFEPLIRV
jgi:hypothetical protein